MSGSRMISTRIEKEYDPVNNKWDCRTQFIIENDALYTGFLSDIPPMQLHTLISLSLFMKENGKIEISLADLARALGISFDQAKKRIESLIEFRYQDKPIIHVNKTRDKSNDSEHFSLSILPVSPITFVDERDKHQTDTFTPENADYLYEYLRMMLNVNTLTDQEKELLVTLQSYPYELPPQVIEVLIEHVIEYKQTFDRTYLMTIASSWSISGIYTKEQAYKRLRETQMMSAPGNTNENPEAYLLQYLRERIQKQPSSLQISLVYQLLEEPYLFDPGCIEALIDHVTAHISITKGKPDFPKKYAETVANDWLEDGVRTREAAIKKVEQWNQLYSLKQPLHGEKTEKRQTSRAAKGLSKVKSDLLEQFRNAGLK